jgi:hypothetical protein
MGKSMSGPDLEDCCIFMQSMEDTHKCTICVLMEAGGPGVGVDWRVSVVASSRTLTMSGPAWTAAVVVRWPDRKYTTFEACLLGALYALDYKATPEAYLKEVLT